MAEEVKDKALPQGQVPPQGCVPPQGYAPPQGQMPPQGYAPPQGQVPPQGYMPPKRFTPQQMLKKTIHSDAGRAIGLILILQLLVQSFAGGVAGIYTTVSLLTGYALDKPVLDFVTMYLPVIVCEIAAIIIGLIWFKTDVGQMFRKPFFRKGEGWKGVCYAGISLGTMQVGVAIFSLIYMLLQQLFHVEVNIPQLSMQTPSVLISILNFSYVVLAGPFMEEIFFRGIIFQKVRKYGDMPAIIFSALLFALFHMNFIQFIGPVLFGLIIGMVRAKTNSIWLCVGIHMLNNGLAVLSEYMPAEAGSLYSGILMVVLIAAAVICAVPLLKDIVEVFRRKGNCTVLSCGAKLGALFNNVWFYLLLGLWLVLSLLTQFIS